VSEGACEGARSRARTADDCVRERARGALVGCRAQYHFPQSRPLGGQSSETQGDPCFNIPGCVLCPPCLERLPGTLYRIAAIGCALCNTPLAAAPSSAKYTAPIRSPLPRQTFDRWARECCFFRLHVSPQFPLASLPCPYQAHFTLAKCLSFLKIM
jgi:hypothetical protein